MQPAMRPGSSALDQLNMRRSNLSLVLRELRHQPRTRAQLAADIYMTKAAVGSLVQELADRGLVRISKTSTPGAIGRPGHTVNVVPERILGLGVSLSVSYVIGAVVDFAGNTVGRHSIPARLDSIKSPDQLIRVINNFIQSILGEKYLSRPGTLLGGLAVGVPDLVDTRAGVVKMSPTVGLDDYPLREVLAQQLSSLTTNIHIDNDANLGALAEYRVGAAAGTANLLYLTGSTGIGGGVIADGRVFRGDSGYAGEVGHLPIGGSAAECSCGNVGCWEAECGVSAFLAAAADTEDPVRNPHTPLDKRFDVIVDRAAAGDPRTHAAIDQAAISLGLGLSGLINVFNPGAVVLGGYFARLFPYLIAATRAVVQQRVMAERFASCDLQPSVLGMYAGAIGAGHLVIDQIVANPAAVPVRTSRQKRIAVDQLGSAS